MQYENSKKITKTGKYTIYNRDVSDDCHGM